MKTNLLYPTLAVLAFSIAACDSFPENIDEVRPTDQTVSYYALPNSIVLIDLSSVEKQFFTSASLTFRSMPSRGRLISIADGILKYEPDWDFIEGEDAFDIIAMTEGDVVGKLTIKILVKNTPSAFPCDVIPIPDRTTINGPGSFSIPALDNDYLCGVDKENLSITVFSQPSQGSATVEGQTIKYTVDQKIHLADSIIYKVTTPNGRSRLGWISLTDGIFEGLRTPDNYVRGELVFLDENTGFYTGSSAIYTTQDGGMTWSRLTKEYEVVEFVDLQFLDPQEGMALYTPCTYGLWTNEFNLWMDCGAYYARIIDRGRTWQEIMVSKPSANPDAPYYVADVNFGSSVFFTSSTKGFIGATRWVGLGFRQTILTTDNAGDTWYSVYTDKVQKPGELKVRFATEQIGYAYVAGYPMQDTLLITEDGGASWKPHITADEIAAIVTTPDALYASLATGNLYSSPSRVVKFEGTSNSGEELLEAPYKVSQIGFSPSGKFGFVGGTKGDMSLGLYKTTDGGVTWVQEDIGKVYGGGKESQRETNMRSITIPSEDVAYILYGNKIIKYTNK